MPHILSFGRVAALALIVVLPTHAQSKPTASPCVTQLQTRSVVEAYIRQSEEDWATSVATNDATVVERFNAAGTVTLGKLNCDEFAMGSSNQNSYFGPVKNPWDTTAIPGGSSGGSAAAIAARLVPAATATDTGGSIRQPASLCGITGIKPTYGRVSRFGMIAFASSLDQAGPMAQTAEDCALLLNAMAGFDPRDSRGSARFARHLEEIRLGLAAFGSGFLLEGCEDLAVLR